jgi:recombination protein RecA
VSVNDPLRAFFARLQVGSAHAVASAPIDGIGTPTLARVQLAGRLVELSALGATSTLTTAIGLVRNAQEESEPAAWIALQRTSFYPPDVADSGVDLDALVVVRVADPTTAARAAEQLLRSGAFGLVIIDLGAGADVPMAHQGRLVTLAKRHDAAVVFLTEKATHAASLGSLISLRVEAVHVRADGGDFACTMRALKDKRRGPGWTLSEKLRAPAGW